MLYKIILNGRVIVARGKDKIKELKNKDVYPNPEIEVEKKVEKGVIQKVEDKVNGVLQRYEERQHQKQLEKLEKLKKQNEREQAKLQQELERITTRSEEQTVTVSESVVRRSTKRSSSVLNLRTRNLVNDGFDSLPSESIGNGSYKQMILRSLEESNEGTMALTKCQKEIEQAFARLDDIVAEFGSKVDGEVTKGLLKEEANQLMNSIVRIMEENNVISEKQAKKFIEAALQKDKDYFQRHGTEKLDLSKKEDVKQFMKEYMLDVLYTPKDQVKKLLKICMRFGTKTEGGFEQELLIRNSKYCSTKTVSRAGAVIYVSYEGYKYHGEKQKEKQSRVLRGSLEQGVQYSSERLEDLDKLQQKQLKAIDKDVKKLKLVLKQENQYQLALEAIQRKENVHEDKEVQAIMVRYLTKTCGMIFNDYEAAERKLKERLDKITSRKERINNRIIENEQHLDSLQELQGKEECNLDNLENLEKLSNSFQKMF